MAYSIQGQSFRARLLAIGPNGKVVMDALEKEHPELFTEKFDRLEKDPNDRAEVYREFREGNPTEGIVRTAVLTRRDINRMTGARDRIYPNIRRRFEEAVEYNRSGQGGKAVILEHDVGEDRWYTVTTIKDTAWG